jgi:hypothetical protein
MSAYFVAFCQVYGVFLFSVYFEFFPDLLEVTPKVQKHVEEMRVALAKQSRWPEMLTYEEWNSSITSCSRCRQESSKVLELSFGVMTFNFRVEKATE